ncbi:MAG: hypothetical protein WBQ41_07745, partial [Solirubrobacterales bacterium]
PEPTAAPAQAMPAIAGASPEADVPTKGTGRCILILGSALVCAAATVAFGVAPSPLIDWASHAASSVATTI